MQPAVQRGARAGAARGSVRPGARGSVLQAKVQFSGTTLGLFNRLQCAFLPFSPIFRKRFPRARYIFNMCLFCRDAVFFERLKALNGVSEDICQPMMTRFASVAGVSNVNGERWVYKIVNVCSFISLFEMTSVMAQNFLCEGVWSLEWHRTHCLFVHGCVLDFLLCVVCVCYIIWSALICV